jgi:porphobilinogen synthase
MFPMQRPRRLRQNEAIRDMVAETSLSGKNLILPVFVTEGKNLSSDVESMPGIKRRSLDLLIEYLKTVVDLGIHTIAVFPQVPEELKNATGCESFNPEGLVPRAIVEIKKHFPFMQIVTDVALDPYNSDGHDGVVSPEGVIQNDITVEVLAKQALMQAHAGADIIAPSDMMDGRIGRIREVLEKGNFSEVQIMAYSAKYASAYYGPFRDALDSAPKAGDKKTYQMDYRNRLEAVREVDLDIAEGADIVMVKPALAYLDIIREIKDLSSQPVAAYNVSGEYAMIMAAAEKGWVDKDAIVLETLTGMRRAGADIILTYFADQVAPLLK